MPRQRMRIKSDPLETLLDQVERASSVGDLLEVADKIVTALHGAGNSSQEAQNIANKSIPAITATSDYITRMGRLGLASVGIMVNKSVLPLLKSSLSFPLSQIVDNSK